LLVGSIAAARTGAAGRPTISGDPLVGQTLTSSSAGDTGVYKWQRCDPGVATCGDNTDKADPNYVDILGATGPDQQSYTLTAADAGQMMRVQAKGTSLGEQFVPSAPVGPVAGGPLGQVVPEFLESGVVNPTCPLEVQEPGSTPEKVNHVTEVPVGTRVDVSDCHADLITVRNANGETQSVDLFGGPFKFFQRQHGKPYIVLKLVGKFSSRAPKGKAHGSQLGARAAGSAFKRCKKILGKKKCRKLVAKGDCLCSTSGAFASGTVRGSRWYLQDGPGYTFAKAIVHKLLVRDKVKKKKIMLHPGESYLARKRH
jgi:hypothetical protein